MGQNKGIAQILVFIILGVLVVGGVYVYSSSKKSDPVFNPAETATSSDTYAYRNHGFTIELPKGFIPREEEAEGGPYLTISLPTGGLSYAMDAAWHEKYSIAPSYTYVKDQKIGETVFKLYEYSNHKFYWFRQGNVGYEFSAPDTVALENLLKTFKFVGWAEENIQSKPIIYSVSPNSASLGTIINITGKNLSGFESDKNIWIVNSGGSKGILYGEAGSTDTSIKVLLKPTACTEDTSYSGKPCTGAIIMLPGTYKIYIQTPSGKSNEVNFTIPKTITITSPKDGQEFSLGSIVTIRYSTNIPRVTINATEARNCTVPPCGTGPIPFTLLSDGPNTGSHSFTIPTTWGAGEWIIDVQDRYVGLYSEKINIKVEN